MITGINHAFVTLYWILTGLMVAALVIIFAISLFGIARYTYETSSQAVSARINRSLVVADTFEYTSLFRAYRTKARANDPYLVYTQEDMLNGIFYLLAIVVMLVGLQVGVTMASSVYSLFRSGSPIDIEFDLPPELIFLVVVTTITALLATWTGLTLFTKNVSQHIVGAQSRADALNAFIFDNLYNNPVFLAKLAGDDPGGALEILIETDLAADVLTRGIFTINVWQYFRNRMPDANPMWEDVKALFTVDAINSRAMDITPFVSYSLYSAIPNSMYESQGKLPVSSATIDTVTDAVQLLMSRVNRLLHNLNPSAMSSSFLTFLIVRTIVLIIALGVLTALFWTRITMWAHPGSDEVNGVNMDAIISNNMFQEYQNTNNRSTTEKGISIVSPTPFNQFAQRFTPWWPQASWLPQPAALTQGQPNGPPNVPPPNGPPNVPPPNVPPPNDH